MIIPMTKKVLVNNMRTNAINDVVKYKTTEQKVYFILLGTYNKYVKLNGNSKCLISYKEIINNLNAKGDISINKIKDILKSFDNDDSISLKFNRNKKTKKDELDLHVEIEHCLIPDSKDTHIVYLEDLLKCKSVNQMKFFILLSSGNKYAYRNFIASLIGTDHSTVEKRKKATNTIKRLCSSMVDNKLLESFSYDADSKTFTVEPIITSKTKLVEKKATENLSIISHEDKTAVTVEIKSAEDNQAYFNQSHMRYLQAYKNKVNAK